MSDDDVRVTCDTCGTAVFSIYYDPKSMGYYVQCDSCATVFLAKR